MASHKPLIGLLGGGQLGRMLCEAAAPLDIPIAILDAADCPAKQINSHRAHVAGSFTDPAKIRALAAAGCDVLTVEIEHVDTAVLEAIATATPAVAVHPSWRTLRLIQDKFAQKEFLAQAGCPVAAQMAVAAAGDDDGAEGMLEGMRAASRQLGFPFMLKARTGSYDGRGNARVASAADFAPAARALGRRPCYAEAWVPFALELAVMVVRTEDAQGRARGVLPYPAVETVHEDSVCTRVFMPPRSASAAVCARAQAVACGVVEKLWGRGVFAVELFVTKDGEVVVNEVAPRPHNSGHYTIEAVPYMSQFKAQLCAILDEPLPPALEPTVASSIMINILGGARPDSHLRLVEQAKRTFAPGVAAYPHLYGKVPKPSRKIGHITLTGAGSIAELAAVAQPLFQTADEIRAERLQAASEALRPAPPAAAAAAADAAPAPPPPPPAPAAPPPPMVLVTMGSDSDLPVLKAGLDVLTAFGVPWAADITSAHRTPARMARVARAAAARGVRVIVAAAGGAAHLPGMLAAYTPLPVIGVPVRAAHLDGLDSLLSIVQMPRGVPTATVAINNSTNAALLAIRFLGAFIPELQDKMVKYQLDMEKQVDDKADLLQEMDVQAYLEKMGKK